MKSWREDADLAAVDGAVAGDHAVAVGAALLEAERRRAVPGQLVELDERALVEEQLDPLAGGLAPLACCFSIALAEPACTASSSRRSRSSSLPAVVWVSMSSGTSVPSPGCALTRDRLVPRDLGPRRTPTARRRGRSRPTAARCVEVVEEAGSTNVAGRRARPGGRAGGAGGRGRAPDRGPGPARTAPGRRRPRSALTFSVLLRPTVPAASWPWLPLLAGYAVSKALRAAGFEASVKWPNDVLLADRKVAGHPRRAGRDAERTGGDRRHRAERRDDRRRAAGARGDVAGRGRGGAGPDRAARPAPRHLWEGYVVWQEGGEAAAGHLAESYAAACSTIGRQVRVDLPSGEALTGTATGIDPSGRLVVDGTAVGAGDVVHVRSE